MKLMKQLWMLAAILFLCGASLTGCKDSTPAPPPPESDVLVEEESYLMTIDRYLTEEIGKQYTPGQVCIPCVTVIDVDESQPDDIKVWGDFWVYNYNLSGDTLKTVSGGSHPGLIHLQHTGKGYEVKSFDVVADGSDNVESAKKIFGDKFDAFQALHSNDSKRESLRAGALADYVRKQQDSSVQRIVFAVGGPYGFSPDVYSRADDKLSLSPMTFSHQMIRLLFVEQYYRALTIIHHLPYHHE